MMYQILERSLRFNGKPAIGIGVTKIRGENTVEIVEKVKERIETSY